MARVPRHSRCQPLASVRARYPPYHGRQGQRVQFACLAVELGLCETGWYGKQEQRMHVAVWLPACLLCSLYSIAFYRSFSLLIFAHSRTVAHFLLFSDITGWVRHTAHTARLLLCAASPLAINAVLTFDLWCRVPSAAPHSLVSHTSA